MNLRARLTRDCENHAPRDAAQHPAEFEEATEYIYRFYERNPKATAEECEQAADAEVRRGTLDPLTLLLLSMLLNVAWACLKKWWKARKKR